MAATLDPAAVQAELDRLNGELVAATWTIGLCLHVIRAISELSPNDPLKLTVDDLIAGTRNASTGQTPSAEGIDRFLQRLQDHLARDHHPTSLQLVTNPPKCST